MICVYSAPSLPTVAWLQERLQDCGIACLVKNQFLSSGAGELPINETWPQLCIFDHSQEAKARQIVAELSDTSGYEDLPYWRCQHCGEDNDAILGFCWNCQRADNEERAQPG